jgi:hypothetical protein
MRTRSGWRGWWSISGAADRSAYLRATLPVMEALARAERLRELQVRNAERAATVSQDYGALLAGIRESYKDRTRSRRAC